MFTLFNTESLWIGTDLKKFNEIRDILDREGICYKYKVSNSPDQFKQYEILVEKKQLENARMVIRK